MRYYVSSAFERGLRSLPAFKKERIKKAIQLAVAFFETGQLPHGLGLKLLQHDFWEIRASLDERVIFQRNKNTIEFILIGSHDDIKRFLKRTK